MSADAGALRLPRRFASLVKIEHTLFALPFAYVGALLSVNAVPSAHDLVWITLAMVGARSLAMGLNRIVDAEVDARNPRTATRELPAVLPREKEAGSSFSRSSSVRALVVPRSTGRSWGTPRARATAVSCVTRR